MKNGIIALIAILAAALLFSGCTQPTEPKACTEEAMECPDSGFVERNPALDCEFNPCPEPTETPAISQTPVPTKIPEPTPTLLKEEEISEAVGDVASDLSELLEGLESAGEDID